MNAEVTPPFPVEPGHTVRFIHKSGVGRNTVSHFDAGHFVRWNRKGQAVLEVRGKERVVPIELLRPSNDLRMQRLRGPLFLPGQEPGETAHETRRK